MFGAILIRAGWPTNENEVPTQETNKKPYCSTAKKLVILVNQLHIQYNQRVQSKMQTNDTENATVRYRLQLLIGWWGNGLVCFPHLRRYGSSPARTDISSFPTTTSRTLVHHLWWTWLQQNSWTSGRGGWFRWRYLRWWSAWFGSTCEENCQIKECDFMDIGWTYPNFLVRYVARRMLWFDLIPLGRLELSFS